MRNAVRTSFVGVSTPFEAFVPFPYLDVKCLVTIGVGNRVTSPYEMAALPLLRSDGTPASGAEKVAEYSRVESRTDLAKLGGGHFAPPVSTLHLSPAAVVELVMGKLDANERILRGRFAEWDSWCADAQLGTHLLAWAAGAAFHFPHFEAYARARDWASAAIESHLDEHGNAGVAPRNRAMVACFTNAAAVERFGLDPETLFYPGQATVTSEELPPTLPELPGA